MRLVASLWPENQVRRLEESRWILRLWLLLLWEVQKKTNSCLTNSCFFVYRSDIDLHAFTERSVN